MRIVCVLIHISLIFAGRGPIDLMSALVQVMAWHWIGDKPLQLLFHPGTTIWWWSHLRMVLLRICLPLSSLFKTLWWRHNDHDSVSNHQPHECLLNHLFRRRSKKTSKLRVTGLCVGNSPGPVNSPHKGPVTRKMFPFDDVIMTTHRHWIHINVYRVSCGGVFNMLLVLSITFYFHYNIWGCVCSTGPFQYGWLKGYIYSSCYQHHQIGSIRLSHCYHIFPSLCAWDVCYIIFCHLLHLCSGKTGNLFSLLLCSLWWVQIVGYVLPCRSYSFVCTVHHLITIIVQNCLKTLNL